MTELLWDGKYDEHGRRPAPVSEMNGMRVSVDQEADILYVKLRDEAPVEESEEVEPGVVVDYDAAGAPVGVEIWNISQRLPTHRALIEALERIAHHAVSEDAAAAIAQQALRTTHSGASPR